MVKTIFLLMNMTKKRSPTYYKFTYSTSTFWRRRGQKGTVKRAKKVRKTTAMNAIRNAGSWVKG